MKGDQKEKFCKVATENTFSFGMGVDLLRRQYLDRQIKAVPKKDFLPAHRVLFFDIVHQQHTIV